MKRKKIIALILLLTLSLTFFLFKDIAPKAYNHFRPLLLDGGGESCIKELEGIGVSFKSLGDKGSSECPIKNAVRISKFKSTTISSPFILSCPTANKVAIWLERSKIKYIKHNGTVNCRKMRGWGIQSEHSYGLAIDITKIDDAVVKDDWVNFQGKGKRLKSASKIACDYFSNVLTPDTNRLHHDHFHLDDGLGMGCR